MNTTFNVAAMASLGKLLARCIMDKSSASSIQDEVVAKLDKRLESARTEIDPFRDIIRDLKAQTQPCGLERLPLFCSHCDLNHMNVMVLADGEISGIIDWELSPPPQPFGMGLHRIHDLAGEFRQGTYYEYENCEEMERSFWSELMKALPANHRETITNNLSAVQTSLTIGTIMWAFDLENEGFFSPAVVRALPKFLTYRIPALRGNGPPYANPPYPGEKLETV